MSWTRALATGSGQFAWRVSIDGFPYEPVSAKSLERTTTDGRKRYVGLRMDGVRLSERVELPYAKWQAEGFTVTVADVKKRWTEAFGKKPQATTWLDVSTSINDTATTFTVQSTAGFATSGQFYVDSETVSYTGTTSTTFTTCTRGRWGSVAQYHYNQIGANTRYPEVTDWPRSIEGRRVRLFVYGAGDDHQSSGTQIWVGVAQTDPRFNGVEWEFNVDPLSVIFDTDIGAELEDPRSIRGIYYPVTAPLFLLIREGAGAGPAFGISDPMTSLGLAGFWASQEAFCADLTTLIATAIGNPISGTFTTSTTALRAEPDGEAWRFSLTTGATARWLTIAGWNGNPPSAVDGMPGTHWIGPDGHVTSSLDTSTTYFLRLDGPGSPDGAGTVPRTTVGFFDASYGAALGSENTSGLDAATNPNGRLYLDGPATAETDAISIDWAANGIGIDSTATVDTDTPDSTDNFVDIDDGQPWWGEDGTYQSVLVATSANPPKIGVVRSLGTGSLADLLTALVTQTARYMNAGTAPFIRPTDDEYSSDINVTSDGLAELRSVADHNPFTANRRYQLTKSTQLSDLIEGECQLVGVFPALNSSGQITFRKLRLVSPSEVSTHALSSSVIVVDDTLLAYERSPWGAFNTVQLSTGYDPIEDDYTGETYKVRDVAAYGQNPRTRTLEIAPKSADGTTATIDDARRVAERVLGVFGAPYDVLTVAVPLTMFPVLLGDVVSVTWGKVPASDGTLGVSGKLGLVIGREWRITEASGSLTILLTDQRIGGYVPSAKISAISGTTGGTGPFTITLSSDYFPTGKTAEDFWAANDKIRVYRWGSATAGTVTGTVSSVSDNTMIITTDAAWTRGTSTWAVGSQISTSITAANQKVFVYLASSAGRVAWGSSASDPAFTFPP